MRTSRFLVRSRVTAALCLPGLAFCAASALFACGSDDASPNSMGSDSVSVPGEGLRMTATLTEDNGVLSFISLTGDFVTYDLDEIVGKPYVVAIFNAGVQSGVDEPIDWVWGTVPESLVLEYASPLGLPDGPYDLSLIVYPLSEITDAQREMPFAPLPLTGELSAFTLSQDEVLPGDPGLTNGVIRVNLKDGAARVALENRSSFVDTVMAVP